MIDDDKRIDFADLCLNNDRHHYPDVSGVLKPDNQQIILDDADLNLQSHFSATRTGIWPGEWKFYD